MVTNSRGLIGIFENFAIVDLKMTSSRQKTLLQFFFKFDDIS